MAGKFPYALAQNGDYCGSGLQGTTYPTSDNTPFIAKGTKYTLTAEIVGGDCTFSSAGEFFSGYGRNGIEWKKASVSSDKKTATSAKFTAGTTTSFPTQGEAGFSKLLDSSCTVSNSPNANPINCNAGVSSENVGRMETMNKNLGCGSGLKRKSSGHGGNSVGSEKPKTPVNIRSRISTVQTNSDASSAFAVVSTAIAVLAVAV